MSAAQVVGAFEGAVLECNGLGRALLDRASSARVPVAGSMLVRGPTIALGARQRASRVLDRDACEAAGVPVARRATSGPHVSIGPSGAAVLALALPSIDALVDDARASTVLNRNVRGWLAALTRHGAIAHYFGREWLSIAKRPAGVFAIDATEDGAVLIELWIGQREPLALSGALASAHERAIDRWLGKSPSSWTESTGRAPLSLEQLDAVQRLAFERYARASSVIEAVDFAPWTASEPSEASRWIEPVPCAIGAIDAAWIDPQRPWIGGDWLAGSRAWAQLERALREERDDRLSSIARCLRDELALGVDAAAIEAAGRALDELAKVVRSDL